MRIPWYIVLLLSLTVFGTVLWIGARNKDFTIEPSQQEVAESVAEWKLKHPALPPRQRSAPTKNSPNKQAATPPQLTHIPLPADLATAPALTQFIEHRNTGSASLIDLAIRLESKGALAHSLLAWERALDSTDATLEQSTKARKAIHQLRKSLPIWNADNKDNFDLVIHIHTPEEHKAELSAHLGDLSTHFLEASSHLVAPQVLIKTAQQREGFPTPPIHVWLSSTGTPRKETPQVTFRPKGNTSQTNQTLEEQLYIALFRSISGQLEMQDNIMPPAFITPQDEVLEAFHSHLTRLHWKKLVDSLFSESQKNDKPVSIEQSSELE